jgi:hypothetical protein
MSKTEEIEEYLTERKKEIADSISFLIVKEEREDGLNEEDSSYRSFLEGQIQFCETMGSTLFNWE